MRRIRLLVTLWILVGAVAFSLPLVGLLDVSVVDWLLEPFRLHISTDKAIYSPAAYFVLLTAVFVLEGKMPVRN